VGAAALAAIIGMLVGWLAWARGATGRPSESSADVEFAREMSVHHAQAVDMALRIEPRTTDPQLALLARDIALTQQGQIGIMQGWLEAWGYPVSAESAATMPGMATDDDVRAISTLPVGDAEVRFLQLMITHHEGGVLMAQDALDSASEDEVLGLATDIEQAQQSEIAAMTQMLNERGADVPPPLDPDAHQHKN
jgi:uncharacterized protein (DUF305 family)